MRAEELAGTKALVRLYLRRDRITLPVWIALLALNLMAVVTTYSATYNTPKAISEVIGMVKGTPALLAITGPVFGVSLGSLVAYKMGALGLAMVALMSFLTVIRHTRGEEEAGRFDLLGSSLVGRLAPLTASLVVAFGANLVLALVFVLVLVGGGLPTAGSVAYSLSWAALGCLFAALAGVAAQLTEGAGSARGIVGITLGVSFLVRALGDMGREGSELSHLSWLSPIGWAQQIRPFGGERWWVFALFGAITVVLTYVAYLLSSKRDVGAGFLPQRLGRATAPPGLCSPVALAWRLQRGALLSWTAAFGLFCLALGSAARSLQSFSLDSPKMSEVLSKLGGRGALVDQYFVLLVGMFGLTVSVYSIQAALRLRSEEEALRVDPLLSAPVQRLRLAVSHLVFAGLGPAVIMAVTGLGMGLGYGSSGGGVGHELPRLLGATMAQLPAVWVVTGLTVALFGLAPRLIALSWVALVAFLMVGQLGELLGLSQSVMSLSPWSHIPKLPGGEVVAAPMVWLVCLAAVLTVAGLLGFRRRDIG